MGPYWLFLEGQDVRGSVNTRRLETCHNNELLMPTVVLSGFLHSVSIYFPSSNSKSITP